MNNKKLLTLLLVSAICIPVLTGAQSTTTASTTVGTTTASTTLASCMQNSLEKRESALITAHDTYNTAVKTALTNRLNSLKSSWNEAERKNRIMKREATYKAFRSEMQMANNALRNSKNVSWKNFQADAKACGVKGSGETPSIISGGNISL